MSYRPLNGLICPWSTDNDGHDDMLFVRKLFHTTFTATTDDVLVVFRPWKYLLNMTSKVQSEMHAGHESFLVKGGGGSDR